MSGDSLRIDELDEQIIAHLTKDARASFAAIGNRIGLSAPAVKRRVDRLRATGVIKGFVALVDPAAAGQGTEAFVEIFCEGRTAATEIFAALRKHAEVAAAYTITGDANALIHLRTRDIEHLEQTLEKLRQEPNIVQTKTAIVLSSFG